MYKRLAFCVGACMLALQGTSVLADEPPDKVFVCTNAQHAATGAAAFKSLFLLDATAIKTTTALKKRKQCWFEVVDIPKKHTTLSHLYIQEGSAEAFVIVPLKVRGVKRYIVIFEDGGPMYQA